MSQTKNHPVEKNHFKFSSVQTLSAEERTKVRDKLRSRLSELKGRKVLVVGDLGRDEYVLGEVRRISPEAPVPVLEVHKEDSRLGLSGNVAQNVASLGGEAWLVAVIGRDSAGEEIAEQLKRAKVSPSHLLHDPERPTIRKLRVMAEHHHIVRVDYELKRYLSPKMKDQLLQNVGQLIPSADVVVIEDYAKGLLDESSLQDIVQMAHRAGKRVMVDPNRSTPAHFYSGVDLMTPNRDEALALSGLSVDELRTKDDTIIEIGQALLARTMAKNLVLTRGKEGMTLFSNGELVHLPTYARQVFDVTGAGDTVIAALSLAWAAGWTLAEACVLANYAAGVVVGKVGSVPCELSELMAYMAADEDGP